MGAGKGELPVRLDAHAPVLGDELVPGRHLVYALERRPWRERRPEGEALLEGERIELGAQPRVMEERLRLRGEHQHALVQRVIKRSHAHAVAREHQALAGAVPQGVGEVAVERGRAPRPLLGVGVQDGLGVAARGERPAARHQRLAQLDVVEDLAVEGHPQRAVRRGERLLAAREVDDRQPPVAERDAPFQVHAALVGAAVAHGLDHALQHRARGERALCQSKIAGDAAHRGCLS
jgi:hypothetical protein